MRRPLGPAGEFQGVAADPVAPALEVVRFDVPARMDAEETETLRRHLEESLLALHAEADRLSGFRDTEPLQVRAATV